MKKIACFFNDSKILERIINYCANEKFEVVDCSAQNFEYDVAIAVYITDIKEELGNPEIKDIPVCFVGVLEKKDPNITVLSENFDNIQFRYMMDALTHGSIYESVLSSVVPTRVKKSFRIDNDIFNIEKIVYSLTKEFIYFIDFSTLEKMRIGFAEILTNAIEHGNLGISGEEKRVATDEGTFYDLINEKLQDEHLKKKKVSFSYELAADGIVVSITDEGSGFDVSSIPDPTDHEALLKLHGRGILITRMYFDELRYNDKGNSVVMKKRFV